VIKSETLRIKFENEKNLHAITRKDNDQRLAHKHQAISNAEALALLEPFAKAYLGLFLEIDNTFKPLQRIEFIASKPLFSVVMQGLSEVIELEHFPTALEIGGKMATDKRLEFGYVILVSMDLFIKKNTTLQEAFSKINPQALSAALCFNYANSCDFKNTWISGLIQYDRKLVAETLQQFWLAQMSKGTNFLPGLSEQLKTKQG